MKSFRKAICLAVAIVFAFAPIVSAVSGDGVICETCKSPVNELIYTKEQGSCSKIVYENEDGTRDGYNARSQNVRPKVILDVCDCPSSNANFQVNKILGMRLTILTEGVYWTNEPVKIQPFATEGAACGARYDANANVYYDNVALAENPDYNADVYKTGDPIPFIDNKIGTVYMDTVTITPDRTVQSPGYINQGPQDEANAAGGVMEYLRTLSDYRRDNGAGYWEYTTAVPAGLRSTDTTRYDYYLADYQTKVTGENLIAAGNNISCSIPVASRAQILQISNAYQIGMIESHYKLCKWFIDLPEMRKDNNVVKPMSELQVKIELIGDDPGGLCAESKAICQCTVTLGVFGADKYTMYFPYVLTQSEPWTSGIAVTNLGTSFTDIKNMKADFTLTDSTGKEFKYTKNDFQSVVWTTMLDALLDKFSGTPAAGAAWLKVEANFPVDGYEFMSDGVFGAGTQPRIYDEWRMRSEKVYADPTPND